jgi:hypothetical protein
MLHKTILQVSCLTSKANMYVQWLQLLNELAIMFGREAEQKHQTILKPVMLDAAWCLFV